MKFIITNTGDFFEELPLEYQTKLFLNNIELTTEVINDIKYYYVDINTIDDLLKIKEVIGKELILADTYDFYANKNKIIEIYDYYRE